MTNDEYLIATSMIWDPVIGPDITTNLEISELLASDLRNIGINVVNVGRKPRSRNKFIVFDIEIAVINGFDMKFLTDKDAQAWHSAKNRSIATLTKAPDRAFEPLTTTKSVEMFWWSQAFNLCYRLGGIKLCERRILVKSGKFIGVKFGL